MSECVFYRFKEGDYHCALSNHDIGDANHVKKYCWGSCAECPIYQNGQKADHHRGTDECIFYCIKDGTAYCQKAGQALEHSTVVSCCRGWNYSSCAVYSDTASAKPTADKDMSGEGKTKEETGDKTDNRAAKTSTGGQMNRSAEVNGSAGSMFWHLVGAVALACWKLIRTIPFWGPYGSILVLLSMVSVGHAGSSHEKTTDLGVALVFLAYLVLHTVLLFKCKRWNVKHKYWPIWTGFILFIITLLPLWATPAVAHQIGVLLYMRQKRKTQTTGNETVPGKKSVVLPVLLPLIVALLFSLIHLYQYRGFKDFTGDYFDAIESGSTESILEMYSWDYVQEDNARIIKQHGAFPGIQDPTLFTSESLEDYVYNHDEFYRFFGGEEIKYWKITEISRNYLSLSKPQIEIEVSVILAGNSKVLTVELEMERGSDGWYMTSVSAEYDS